MTPLSLPKLSMTMEEATVSSWLVADGDTVEEGQAVLEVETDKAQSEVTAPAGGVLRIAAAEGTQVPVDGLLGRILAPGETLEDDAPAGGDAPAAAPAPVAAASVATTAPAGARSGAASPAAKRAAKRLGVDLASVAGTGPRGRITVADVEAAGASAPAAAPAAPAAASPAPAAINGAPVAASAAPVAAGGLRQAVLANIVASWQAIPHIHISGELDVAGLVEARRRQAGADRRATVTDLLLLALSRALVDVPELNGTVENGAPRRAADVNLSVAVATDQGVIAPVLTGASDLSLSGITKRRGELVAAARAGTLAPRDLGGGSCTLSNLGLYPVDHFAPVVSGPQIAMVAVGRVSEKPVAVDGMIGIGQRMTFNVAIDHRGADGEAGGRLLSALQDRLAELPTHV